MLNLWGWMAPDSGSESSDDEEARRRQQAQVEAYTKKKKSTTSRVLHQITGASTTPSQTRSPRKLEYSGGSAGITRPSKSNKFKHFLGIHDDIDNDLGGGKINREFKFKDSAHPGLVSKERVIDDIGNLDPAPGSDGTTTTTTTTRPGHQSKPASTTVPSSKFDRPHTKANFNNVKATYGQFENEEEEILTDMTSILTRLGANSTTIHRQLDTQTGLLTTTRELMVENQSTMDRLAVQMDKLIESSSCGHWTIIWIELLVFFILLGLIMI